MENYLGKLDKDGSGVICKPELALMMSLRSEKNSHQFYMWIDLILGKFHNDLTRRPHHRWWLVREIIPFYGRKFQVSELLYFAQMVN